MSRQRWTEQQDHTVLTMCAEGATSGTIGAALGRTRSSVQSRIGVLRAAGHEVSERPWKGRPQRDDALRVTMSPRFSDDEVRLIRAAAAADGVPPCTWIRMKAVAALTAQE